MFLIKINMPLKGQQLSTGKLSTNLSEISGSFISVKLTMFGQRNHGQVYFCVNMTSKIPKGHLVNT